MRPTSGIALFDFCGDDALADAAHQPEFERVELVG